ncbi:uncharacterized protein [Aegilops tauschii subsp. strangulata]|uniref:uncharacterized protein isoform X2 n=1 Tax=Aegilops tauschii subsp. strangulata TaxID=200361 RepID=UPI00098B3B68
MARRLHLPAMHPTSPRGVSTPADASRRPMPRRRASPPHAPSPRAAAPCPITVRRHPQPPLTAGSDPTTIAMARRLHLPAMHPTSPRGVSTPADASRRPNPPLPRVSMGNIQPVPEPHPTGAAHCSRGASAPRRQNKHTGTCCPQSSVDGSSSAGSPVREVLPASCPLRRCRFSFWFSRLVLIKLSYRMQLKLEFVAKQETWLSIILYTEGLGLDLVMKAGAEEVQEGEVCDFGFHGAADVLPSASCSSRTDTPGSQAAKLSHKVELAAAPSSPSQTCNSQGIHSRWELSKSSYDRSPSGTATTIFTQCCTH